jgi:hypothetical protein
LIGEYGRLAKPDTTLQAVIAFHDIYEIGMSNQALRILYNALKPLDILGFRLKKNKTRNIPPRRVYNYYSPTPPLKVILTISGYLTTILDNINQDSCGDGGADDNGNDRRVSSSLIG